MCSAKARTARGSTICCWRLRARGGAARRKTNRCRARLPPISTSATRCPSIRPSHGRDRDRKVWERGRQRWKKAPLPHYGRGCPRAAARGRVRVCAVIVALTPPSLTLRPPSPAMRERARDGGWPRRMGVSAWGTANRRTGGDDIAQALALLGVRPVWEGASGRVTGFEILPADVLDRPRVDVTLRISGFFRDAFPGLIDLFDSAVRAVAALDEPADINPLAASVATDRQALEAKGIPPDPAAHRAGYRIFGSQPGAYGAGLQTLIDERIWEDEAELAGAYLGW